MRLTLSLALAATLAGVPRIVTSQDVMDARSAAHLKREYVADLDTLHAKILALATAIPADKYAWRPAPGVRSIAEALMHVASEYYYWTPMSVAGKAPADYGPPREANARLEKIAEKSAVLAELNKSWAHCQAQLAAADPAALTGTYKPWGTSLAGAAFAMSGDLHEHLGQLIAYARSVGVKPPWSK